MSNIKISEWIEAESVNEDDYVPIIQNGINKKVKASEIGTGGGGGDTLPIGAVVELASNTVPNNWLLCNGQAVSRTEYADLFRAIGTTWGAGDGSTTFNLPNRAGLIAIGAGTHTDTNGDSKTFVLGQEYGEYEHTLSVAEMPSHSHSTNIGARLTLSSGSYGTGSSSPNIIDDFSRDSSNTGGNQSHNNIQPSIATNFIIKARQSVGVSASVIQEDGTPNETDVYSSEAIQAILDEKNTYSTEEKVVGTWIDGKPLYRKVYSTTSKANIDLSNLNCDYIEIVRTRLKVSGYTRNPYYTSSSDYFRTLIDSNENLMIEASASSINNWTTVIEYTKTTD